MVFALQDQGEDCHERDICAALWAVVSETHGAIRSWVVQVSCLVCTQAPTEQDTNLPLAYAAV